MLDLKINGQSVDLPEKPITRKIQIAEVGDLGNSKSSFSYSVLLPFTDNNRRIFRGLKTSGNLSRIQYEDVRADLVEDGIPLVFNGKLVFKNSSKGYNVNILDGIISIVETLGNKKLSQLDLSDLDHTANEFTIFNSLNNLGGYTYGMARFGGSYLVELPPLRAKKSGVTVVENARNLDFNPPSIFVHTIFQKILDENGLKFNGNMFDLNFQQGVFDNPNFFGDESFYSELVAPYKGVFLGRTDSEIQNKSLSGGYRIDYQRNDYDINVSRFNNEFSVNANLQFNGGSGFGVVISGNNFSVNQSGLYYLKVDFEEFENTAGLINDGASFTVLQNGERLAGRNDRNNIKTDPKTRLYRFESGVSYSVDGSYIYKLNESTGTYQLKGRYGMSVRIERFNDYKQISPESLLKDMNQIDFLRDVIKRYGWQLIPNKTDQTSFLVKSIQSTIISNNREDWSDKLVSIRDEKYKSNYARRNLMTYKYFDNARNIDSSISIEDKNLKYEGSVLSSIINIPPLIGSPDRSVYRIGLYDDENQPEEKDFVVYKRRVVELGDFFGDITLIGFKTIDLPENIVVASAFNMEMSFFKEKAFSGLELMLNNYKEIIAEVNLNKIDIYNLDFTKLKFFRQLGRNYLLNTVTNTSGKNSICELIEVANLENI